jgi:hypothetical protein
MLLWRPHSDVRHLLLREVVGQGNFEHRFPRKAEPRVERPIEVIASKAQSALFAK